MKSAQCCKSGTNVTTILASLPFYLQLTRHSIHFCVFVKIARYKCHLQQLQSLQLSCDMKESLSLKALHCFCILILCLITFFIFSKRLQRILLLESLTKNLILRMMLLLFEFQFQSFFSNQTQHSCSRTSHISHFLF